MWVVELELYEFESKRLFVEKGIAIPRGFVVECVEDVDRVSLRFPLVVKVQIPISGRGRLGGIVRVGSIEELRSVVARLLDSYVAGFRVRRLLVEEVIDVVKELYLAIAIDRAERRPVILASSVGGMDIEEIARREPWRVVKRFIDPLIGVRDYELRYVAYGIGLRDSTIVREFIRVAKAMYSIFTEYECELVESNPLGLTSDGKLVALDAKVVVDDSALYRHRDLEEMVRSVDRGYSEVEMRAREHGFSYIELDGDIGVIGNGAGLTMATMDLVQYYGGKPANFLDIGGGARAERVREAVKLLLENPRVRAILINILGGITRVDEVAKGIVEAIQGVGMSKPIVVRLKGTGEDEGRKILAKLGIPLYDDIDEAAKRVVELVKNRGF